MISAERATAPPAVDQSADEDLRAIPPRSPIARWASTTGFWVLVVDVVLIVLFGLWSQDHVFWSLENVQALSLGGTEALLLALGLTVVLGAGIFDLSVAANLVLASVVGTKVLIAVSGVSVDAPGVYSNVATATILAVAACLVTGTLFGLVNGLIIAYLDVNSIIATLGTLGIGTGIALLITNGSDVGGLPTELQTDFAFVKLAGIPIPMLMALGVAGALWLMVRTTRYGIHTLALGSSRAAAERAGLRVRGQIVSLAMLCGMLAGLAGFIDISRFGSTAVSGHSQDALAAATAVLIGGTALEGGRVSIGGTICGAVFAIVLQGGLVVVGVKPFWQLIAVGAVLLTAVSIDRMRTKHRETH